MTWIMKIKFSIIILNFLFISLIHGQTLTDSTAQKITKQDRLDEYAKLNDWMKQFFNHPESGWFVNVNASYGTPFITSRQGSTQSWLGNTFVDIVQGSRTESVSFGSAGGGFGLSLQFGRMHNLFLGYGADITYSNFPKITEVEINDRLYQGSQITDPWLIGLSPFILLSSGNMRNFYVFAKVGPYFPMLGNAETVVQAKDNELRLLTDFILENTAAANLIRGAIDGLVELYPELPIENLLELNVKAEANTSFKFTVGITASFGFKYQISDIVSFTTEGKVTAFSIEAKQTVLDNFIFDGKIIGQNLGQLLPDGIELDGLTLQFPLTSETAPQSFIITNYQRRLDQNSNNKRTNASSYDINQPLDELAFKVNSSAIYLSVGIQLSIPKKANRQKSNAPTQL
jgi:hypothetical protein